VFAPLIALLLAVPSQQASDAQIAAWIADDLRRDSRNDRLDAAERLAAAGVRDDLLLARVVGGRLAGAGAQGVVVGVHDGEVVLHGRARDTDQREKLLALASDVSGVRGVDSRALLLPGEELVETVPVEEPAPPAAEPPPVEPFAFVTRDGLAGRGISVQVSEGLVTLAGEASSDDAVTYAAGVAQRVPGVRAVRNRLTVRPDNPITDRGLELMIERELEGDVLVQSISSAILITVHHGVVRLTGKVLDEGQRAQAERVASGISATFAIDNQLQVDEDLVLTSRGRIPGFRDFRRP